MLASNHWISEAYYECALERYGRFHYFVNSDRARGRLILKRHSSVKRPGAAKRSAPGDNKRAQGHTPRRAKAGRPPAHEIASRQKNILDVAMQEFCNEGFGGANIERIARKAGVGKATIYRNFGDKPALFEAIVRSTMGRIGNIWNRVAFDLDDPRSTLRAVARASYDQWTSESLGLYRIIFAEATRMPDVARTVQELTHDLSLRPVEDYLQALKDRGVLRFADAFWAAATFTEMAVGGTRFLLMPATLTDKERDEIVDEAVSMFLHGTMASAAGPGAGSSR